MGQIMDTEEGLLLKVRVRVIELLHFGRPAKICMLRSTCSSPNSNGGSTSLRNTAN